MVFKKPKEKENKKENVKDNENKKEKKNESENEKDNEIPEYGDVFSAPSLFPLRDFIPGILFF